MTILAPALTAAPKRQAAARGVWIDLALLVLCLGIIATADVIFAAQQHLWLDETTQLSGLSLGPVGVTRWLAGVPHDFGTPTAPDRTPPLSYWVHWLWSQMFGGSQWSLRMAGVTMVSLACGIIFLTAWQEWGRWSACLATLLVGLCASIVEKSPEIRPYPLYLLVSVIAYAAMLAYIRRPTRWRLTGLGAALVVVLYTHFLGVLFVGAIFGALGAVHLRFKRPLPPLFVAAGAVALCGLGLVPFVSNAHHDHWLLLDRVYALADLLWNLAGQHVLTFQIPFIPVAAIPAVVAVAAAIVGARGLAPAGFAALMVMVLGLGVILAATFLTGAFKPGLFQYNLWLVPASALVLTALANGRAGFSRKLGRAAAILVLASVTISAACVDLFASRVAHGPDPKLLAQIRELGPDRIAMVHERGSGGTVVQLYFSMHFEFQNRFPQIDSNDAGFFDMATNRQVALADMDRKYAVVVLSSGGLPWDPEHPQGPPAPGSAVEAFSTSKKWSLLRTFTVRGMMRNTVWIFQHVETPAQNPRQTKPAA